MAQLREDLDFSGLLKLDVLLHLDIASYSFYESGLKKFFAFASDKQLFFIYINPQGERFDTNYDWDFNDNPIHCMCFEPSGTWVIIVSEQKILLVPFLPLFSPQDTFDFKWSLSSVSVLPLGIIQKPLSVIFWLTKDSENVLIIGSKNGVITFYSLESINTVGEIKVPGEISDLQICFDDSLDLLSVLISGSRTQQWKLVLEHRSLGYNWLQQIRVQTDKDKRDGFMSYIRQLSKDKITLFIQSAAKGEGKTTIEYALKPTDYLPAFRRGCSNWNLTAQYVDGRHFLSAFEFNEGILVLECPEETAPSRTLRPKIKYDGLNIQALWSQKLIYILKKNVLEIHSSSFSVYYGDGLLAPKRDYSEIWSAQLPGTVRRIHLMSAKEPQSAKTGWREPTFLCDLKLQRFNLESCLVVTSCGAYIMHTIRDPCEWLVSLIMCGDAGSQQAAAALGVHTSGLLNAAADMIMSRGNVAHAQYLHSLSQSTPDTWVARLGAFGRLQELSMYRQTRMNMQMGGIGNTAITIKLLALLLKMSFNDEVTFDMSNIQLTTSLTSLELTELSNMVAAMGLWNLIAVFSTHRGHPSLILSALKSRREICRGAFGTLLHHRYLVPLLLQENSQWLFSFITEKCNTFDSFLLKCLALWLNPLQDELRPVMRDLKQGITTIYTTRMLQLITTFVHIVSAIERREPCPDISMKITETPETWKNQFVPKKAVSGGHAHWAVVDEGNAKVMIANTAVNTDIIGRVIDVACGRHHTLLLTENGVYSSGDNTYGQLGLKTMWVGAVGDMATASGALYRIPMVWPAPLVTVAAGHYHSAAIDQGGRLFTWGWGVHGQLGLGSVEDQYSPQVVTTIHGRKVLSVGCGACHTAVLVTGGEVWVFGATVFGQLGAGVRDKSSLPIPVMLPDPVVSIAVGYFHTLALTVRGVLWSWGASPQQVRAAHARPGTCPEQFAPLIAIHLAPVPVDTGNVRGRIVQLAAGWHHSCLIDSYGTLYTWGLNFDGQLGSGDRKSVLIPTPVRPRNDSQPDKQVVARTPEVANKEVKTSALVACGGDFTVYIDDDGRIYATGNMHLPVNNEKEKGVNRVFVMKTTKRVLKIAGTRGHNKLSFEQLDRLDIMFPFDTDGLVRKPIEPRLNPVTTLNDFKGKTWADDIILLLKPWINEENFSDNLNMAAKLAFHNQSYTECLKKLLDNLKTVPQDEQVYLAHADVTERENNDIEDSKKKDELRIDMSTVIAKRIKDISLTMLNHETYPKIDPAVYQTLSCCCDEAKYLANGASIKSENDTTPKNLSSMAADIIDKCLSMFPVNTDLWETCVRLSKNFYLENNLSVTDLEAVLHKYMESNASTMAAAIMCFDDCSEYSEILSPKFYLNMCSHVLDTWG